MPVPVLQYRLPDTLAQWPYPATLNLHHWEIKAASDAWLASFNAFDPKAQNAFIRCDFGQYLSPHLTYLPLIETSQIC